DRDTGKHTKKGQTNDTLANSHDHLSEIKEQTRLVPDYINRGHRRTPSTYWLKPNPLQTSKSNETAQSTVTS
ncbi:MAG: hypothetical protein VX262_09830, partial [Acidobacteriota bacterium]|nr:hypothetical protein [Acidobacteriota bacterium]